MTDSLLIRLHADGHMAWRRGDESLPSRSGVPLASDLEDASEVIVLAPGEDVLLTDVAVAAKQRSQLLRAVPFATEDQLLGSVEDQHFAITDALPAVAGEPPRYGVAVVSRARLRGWLDKLGEAGIRADVLIPDTLAVAAGSAVIEEDRAVVRLGPTSALVCAPSEVEAWLQTVGIDAAPTAQPTSDALAAFARNLPATPALNLLVGEFAPAHRQEVAVGRLRKLAILAAAVVVLALVTRVAEVMSLRADARQLDAATVAELQVLLPDRSADQLRQSDVATLLADRMPGGAAGVDSGVLDLLARLAPVLGTGTRIQLRGLEYRSGTLELALRAPDIPALESLRERLAAQAGLSVEFTGSNPGENGVDGRLRIRGGAL
ncbi:MAG: type II secretion system protein GspL [Dokdonella sp.]